MKILLVLPETKGSFDVYRPPAIARMLRFFYPGFDVGTTVSFPPLGLLTIAACTPPDIALQIVDEKVNGNVDFEADADLVGISIFAHSARRGYDIADLFRKKGRKVVLGGFHVSCEIEEALTHADAIVVGEAEPVWSDLIKDLKAGRLKRIYDGRGFLPLEQTPTPRYDLLKFGRYMIRNAVQATRGCPFRCEFCSVAAFFRGSFRVKPVEQVLGELGPLSEGDLVCFVDDNLVGSPPYAKALFKKLIPYKIRWISQTSITIANDSELLNLAKESGCACLLVGIESVEPANLSYMRGKIKLDELEEQLARIHEVGIGINGTFILGLDGDKPETFAKTADFCLRNFLEVPSFMVFNPLPGTPVYRRMQSEGRLRTDAYREYEDLLFRRKLFYSPKGMSEREFYTGFDEMCREVYSYANILRRNLKYRISFKEFIYANFIWRQCDFQIGKRSLANPDR